MSVDYFRFKTAGRQAEKGLKGSERRSLEYVAKTSTASDTEETVIAAGPFQLGSAYNFGGVSLPACQCSQIKVAQERTGDRVWSVVYQFDTASADQDKPEDPNPLNWAPRYNIRKEKVQKVLWKDRTPPPAGPKPTVNSAKGRFAQPIMADHPRLIIVVTRNETFFNIPLAVSFFATTNQDVFWGQPSNHVLCESITATKVWERYGDGEIGYWEVAYELHFDRDGWNLEVLDEGTWCWEPIEEDGVPTRVKAVPKDGAGIPFVGPILLNGNGLRLPDGRVESGDVEYITFQIYDRADFNVLNLPYPQ